jgi:hypothetical protein
VTALEHLFAGVPVADPEGNRISFSEALGGDP